MSVSSGSVKSFCYLLLLLLGVWMCLVSTLQWQETLVGVLLSVVLALFLSKSFGRLGLPPISPRRVMAFVLYLFVLAKEIVKANLDVAYRILHPKMPIRPGIVTIKTNLKQDIAKLMLANSITLTPGTFTVDIVGDTLLIHWINVTAEEVEETTRIIGRKFEKYLKPIFD